MTLAQIVYEQEKKKKDFLPVATLRGMIRDSGRFFERTIGTTAQHIKDDAEKKVSSIKVEAEKRVSAIKGDAEDLQSLLDDRIKQLLGTKRQEMSKAYREDIQQRLNRIEKKLDEILKSK